MSTTEPQFNDPPRPFHQYPLVTLQLQRLKGKDRANTAYEVQRSLLLSRDNTESTI